MVDERNESIQSEIKKKRKRDHTLDSMFSPYDGGGDALGCEELLKLLIQHHPERIPKS